MKGLFAKLLGRYRETDFLFPERLFMRLENHVSQSKMRLLAGDTNGAKKGLDVECQWR